MKQILQSLKTGVTEIVDVPRPDVRRGQLLIATSRTLVSAGTERMLVDFGRATLLGKARQQPERVRMVLDKIRTDGLVPTIESVLNRLDQPLPMGYCNVGTVQAIGAGVTGFAVGDRVVSNGKHADFVSVPVNLCARIPAEVADDDAAFTVLGAIALQALRLIQPTLGEAVVVTGLGLIGLLTVQLLRAQGCRVLGVDFDPRKLALAREFGADVADLGAGVDPVVVAQEFSRGRGVDAVVVAAATPSSEPIHQAALMCRKRGRIVLVGVTGLELSRADFYEKELSFQVSCSYGPGRYDPAYEEQGFDYPVGYVRWTEQRNFEAVLDMLAQRRLSVGSMISERFPIDEAHRAYDAIVGSGAPLGILIDYQPQSLESAPRTLGLPATTAAGTRAPGASAEKAVSFVGAGNYATAMLIPAFKAAGARLRMVASAAGVSGFHAGRKFGFEQTTTSVDDLLADPAARAVIISTRHDSHADLTCRAFAAGKDVYVEKPLAVTLDQLRKVAAAWQEAQAKGEPRMLMVGFNRRFAPQVVKIRSLLGAVPGVKSFVMTVNAGAIPAQHWTQSADAGGGRIIGEACHFIDLLRFLAGLPITSSTLNRMKTPTGDTATINLVFADGSIGTIHYFANGSKSFPKERLEVFASGRVLQLDNFRRLTAFGWPGFRKLNLWRQDKGQRACAGAFLGAMHGGGDPPIPFDELIEVARISIELGQAP